MEKFGGLETYSYLCNVKIIQVAKKKPPKTSGIFCAHNKQIGESLEMKYTVPGGVGETPPKVFYLNEP